MQTASPSEAISFRNGQLYLSSKWGTLVIQAWPKPGAWTYRDEGEIRMGCSLFTSFDYSFHRYDKKIDGTSKVESHKALNITVRHPFGYTPSWKVPVKDENRALTRPFFDFIQQIPKELRTLLARYASGHWDMLRLASQNPAFVDLMRINPALAYCLVEHTKLRNGTSREQLREVVQMAGRKQREILGWLGFPNTESAVHILRKIPPIMCCVGYMKRLRSLLKGSVVPKLLSHVTRINPAGLFVFEPDRGLLWSTRAFRKEVISWFPDRWNLDPDVAFDDVVEMATRLGIAEPIRIESLDHLLGIHTYLLNRFHEYTDVRFRNQVFPRPPLAGNQFVVPLDTYKLLSEEGRVQHHCVAFYAAPVCKGNAYIYRVLAPERATLSLERRRDTWSIGQLLGMCNRSVKAETRKVVMDWFYEAQRLAGANEIIEKPS